MSASKVNRELFMRRLRRSGLLPAEQMRQAYDAAAETADGRELGQLLVARKVLTRFQARMLLAGRTEGFFLGQYKILEPIGQGGMGRVFKAEHVGMGRLVALKLLSPDLVQTERARQLFDREVKLVARLQHPHIVTAYDADHQQGRYFLVLEYVDGPDLQTLVRREGPLPIGVACELIRQAALGLQYAHELGMVHRDIKPSNLLVQRTNPLGPGPLVKILDFGLARLSAADEAIDDPSVPLDRRTVIGTPDYISPEQARDWRTVDIRSDLYSLGCTFYFLLTGRPPFPGGNALQKLVRQVTERPTPVTELRPDVPAPVVEILNNLIAKNPLERYQIPLDAAVALRPYCFTSTACFGSEPHADPDSFAAPADSSSWMSHASALTALPGSSASILLPAAKPNRSHPKSWPHTLSLVIGIAFGFTLGIGFWLMLLLLGIVRTR